MSEIEERVSAWAEEHGLSSLPVEDIISWNEEELKAEAAKPSEEDLEKMQYLH